ncbi:hypothetical protein CK203_085898 [Vitis vinifera]|uniref:Reverse transcriptase zinc-binding domain-containing protein n=1 Tax=Vitis vinifera TaxID=29760 RepID=A0A438DI23_VITVI|nr:hypothetical protein CK203_085898 [Vitis vinifera]
MEELEVRKEAKGDFEKWALMEEVSWRQKSREVWLRRGDRNTDFFHKMANSHKRRNCLSKIKINGTWIDVEEAARLEEVFSEEEVFFALLDLNGDKAPGPDAWQICKEPEFNLLVLIPKKAGAENLRDFRPISLILDAALIANEAIDSLLKRNEVGCKLDLEKAYNHLNCNFLLFVMQSMGFGEKWTGWISWCISTTSFSVLVNGTSAAISGLRINLDKSEILPVGRVENLEALDLEVGCKVGRLPSSYLGIPLGANYKSVAVWDGVGREISENACHVKMQFISKGGRITLIRSTLSSMPNDLMSLLRMQEWVAWELDVCLLSIGPFYVSGTSAVRMKGRIFGGMSLVGSSGRKKGVEAWVVELCDPSGEEGVWSPSFSRPFNDWEVEEVERLLLTIRGRRLNPLLEDRMLWKETTNEIFSVKSLYNVLASRRVDQFPNSLIWSPCVPTKVSFFAWRHLGVRCLLWISLKRGVGFLLIDASFAVRKKSQLIIFLFIAPGQELYESYCLLFLELLGSFLFRLEIPLLDGVVLTWARSVERLKNSFVCNLWSWTKSVVNEGNFIVVKGAPRLRAAQCHPPVPRLKASDAPSRRRRLGATRSTGAPRSPTSFFSALGCRGHREA